MKEGLLQSCYILFRTIFSTVFFFNFPPGPTDWRNKTWRANVPAKYRPVARTRPLYTTCAYMILARVDLLLETAQPEAQHGFRSGRRIEEHLVTPNLLIQESWGVNMLLWIVCIGHLGELYPNNAIMSVLFKIGEKHVQKSNIPGTNEITRLFDIKRGVRQGHETRVRQG